LLHKLFYFFFFTWIKRTQWLLAFTCFDTLCIYNFLQCLIQSYIYNFFNYIIGNSLTFLSFFFFILFYNIKTLFLLFIVIIVRTAASTINTGNSCLNQHFIKA